jgi:hypothetical protein
VSHIQEALTGRPAAAMGRGGGGMLKEVLIGKWSLPPLLLLLEGRESE